MSYETKYASCSLTDPANKSGVTGVLSISQTEGERTFVKGSISGLTEGANSVNVHSLGTIQGYCSSAGPAVDSISDAIVEHAGVTSYEDATSKISLFDDESIIGRAMSVNDVDGNAVACCVVGIDEP